jgi:hypothetical protein
MCWIAEIGFDRFPRPVVGSSSTGDAASGSPADHQSEPRSSRPGKTSSVISLLADAASPTASADPCDDEGVSVVDFVDHAPGDQEPSLPQQSPASVMR